MAKLVDKIGPFLQALRLALAFVWEGAPRLTLAGVLLRVIQGLLPLATLYWIKLLVDAVAEVMSESAEGLLPSNIVFIMGGLAAVALLTAVCATLSTLVSRVHSQVMTDHMHAILHAKSVEVDLEYYENSQYYDKLHRAQEEAPYRPGAILYALLQLGQDGVSLVAIVGLLWWFHWAIVPVLFLAALPDLLVRLRYSNKLYVWERERTPLERRAWYLNWMLTRDTHAKELRLFNLGPRLRQWFQDARATLRRERVSLETRWALAGLGAQTVAAVCVFGVYMFVVHRTIQGALSIGDLVMYFGAVQRGAAFLESLGGSLSGLYESSLFLTNLDEFLKVKPKLHLAASPKPLPKPLRTGLAFEHVQFQYQGETRFAVDDFDLQIRPGEHIALVGANGAGKTTLVKLLCRLYDPTLGRITLDGIDLRELDLIQLRGTIGGMFQDFVKYQMTVYDNITLAVPGTLPFDEVMTASRKAGLDELIARLPQGYDTLLGKWFDGGHELSIGEWQKIALARAFLRDAQILILDEPTSAMDAKAEAELFGRFHELAHDRTAILISHRLSTVKMVDRIYVLSGGRIAESGTHVELMCRGGVYATLFTLQAQNYQLPQSA